MFQIIQPPALTHPAPAALGIAPPQSGAGLRSVYVSRDVKAWDLVRLDSITSSTRMVKAGSTLFRANDLFQCIYTIRAGSFKTVVAHRDGGQQVTGFHLIDDALGLDGIYTGHYSCNAVAIEDSNVCIIQFDLLEHLCREVKAIQQHVHRMISSEIVRQSEQMVMLGTMSADQRLAAFLLNMSRRLKVRGCSPVEINLRMTRNEIGSYLGMQLETVSRMFSKFRLNGLVDTNGKQIRILDLDGLSRV